MKARIQTSTIIICFPDKILAVFNNELFYVKMSVITHSSKIQGKFLINEPQILKM